jgi:hypothetical protein
MDSHPEPRRPGDYLVRARIVLVLIIALALNVLGLLLLFLPFFHTNVPVPTNVIVRETNAFKTIAGTEEITLTNCGGTGDLELTLAAQTPVIISTTIGTVATTSTGARVEVPKAVRLALADKVALAYQGVYETASSRSNATILRAEPNTCAIYIVSWEEQGFYSLVSYTITDEVCTVPYIHTLYVPKVVDRRMISCAPATAWVTPTPSPTAMVEAEWPETMEIDRSDYVRVSLIRTTEGKFAPTVEVAGHTAVVATVKPVGTVEAPMEGAFGPAYQASAIAKLEGTAFEIRLLGAESQSLDQDQITWDWNILPIKPGRQIVNACVIIRWQPIEGEWDAIERTVWRAPLPTEVEEPWIKTDQLVQLVLGSGLLGSILSAPWLYQRVRGRGYQQPRAALDTRAEGGASDERHAVKSQVAL